MRDVLEAAHIRPYAHEGTNSVNNGLLLRADIHVLFDLRLLSINPSTKKIYCAKRLRASQYAALNGKKIEFPVSKGDWPDHEALRRHFEETKD